METLKKTKDAVIEYLEGLSDSELLTAHRQMCENQNRCDDEIYDNDEEFFETYFSGKVNEAVRAVCYGDYEYQHDYVRFNGYANLESTNYLSDFIDLPDLADDILDNPHDYDVEFEEEPTKVTIRKEEDGSYSIVDEDYDIVSDGFETHEDALDWLEGDDDYITIN